jgi:photosystem II stability/assembly factor-like uncharacterized protein
MGARLPVRTIEWLKENAKTGVALGWGLILALVLLPACSRSTPLSLLKRATPIPPPVPQRWTRLNLFDGQINTLLIDDTTAESPLYAGTDGGVFKSEDQGKTWLDCNESLPDRLVRSLVVAPNDSRTLYAGTWNGKVHISTDAGKSWTSRSMGLPPYEVRGLAVDTFDPNRVYAGLPQGVFTTTNKGGQWVPAGEFPGSLQCLALDPEHPSVLYVGTAANGLYKSTTAGASWFSLHTVFTDVTTLVMLPRQPSSMYAISRGKVYRTENEGLSWSYVDSYRDPAVARCLAVNPKLPDQVYVGLQDGLYKSKDGRKSWARSDVGLASQDVRIVAVDPVEPNRVYACVGTALWLSTDAGATWQARSSIQGDTAADVMALAADPKHGEVFYVSTAGGGVYKTTDRGKHWQHVGENLPLGSITVIQVEPINTQVVYLGIEQGFVFKSIDGGGHWVPAGGVAEAPIITLAIDAENPQRLYAGTSGQGLFRSDDGGTNWFFKGKQIGLNVKRIALDLRGPQNTVYALTDQGVFRSQDAGESWSPYLSPVADLSAAAKGSQAPVVLTQLDGSALKGQGIGEPVTLVLASRVSPGAELKALTVSPTLPGVLYVLAQNQGVLQSADQGATWGLLGTGLESLSLHGLAASADDPNLILVGTNKGLFRYGSTGD